MADPVETAIAGLLARKGEARPAMCPDNDNDALVARSASIAAAMMLAGGRGAAVTLRLDAERHMRLRIACALGRSSAQAIVNEALDAHLKTIPGIERLVAAAMADSGGAATGWGSET